MDTTLAILLGLLNKTKSSIYNAALVPESVFGSVVSFADGADDVSLKDLVVNIVPKQAGTGDPSSSNIRTISGWAEANIYRTGKNVFTLGISGSQTVTGVTITVNNDGTISTSGTNEGSQRISYPIGTYTITDTNQILTGCPSGGGSSTYELIVTQTGGSTVHDYGSGASLSGYALGSTINVNLIIRTGVNATGLVFKPMIRNASDNAEYEPYSHKTYNVPFGVAGTVYGGTLDVTSGVLTVTHGYIDSYDGETLTGEWISDRDVYASGTTPTTGAQVVYELDNPISYQINKTEIKTLLGRNNIWSDTGSVESCEYRADTKLYLEKLTNPDDDMVANTNIASGSYFMVGNNLYLATAAIASGASIIVGTNCTQKSLAEALNEINT